MCVQEGDSVSQLCVCDFVYTSKLVSVYTVNSFFELSVVCGASVKPKGVAV